MYTIYLSTKNDYHYYLCMDNFQFYTYNLEPSVATYFTESYTSLSEEPTGTLR